MEIKKYVYLHICCFNNWKKIVCTFLEKMVVSKLYFAASEVRCVVLGKGDISDLIQKYPKIRVIFQSDDTSFYERKILQLLHEKIGGLRPSTQTILPHLPQSIEVRIGSISVVSTLYIALPASGSKEASGAHDSIFSGEMDF